MVVIAAGGRPRPRRRAFKPAQTVAIIGSSIVFLLAVAALGHAALAMAVIPSALKKTALATHVAIMLAALPVTIVQLAMPKGTHWHRRLGYLWCGLMVATALVSFGVHQINGGFSWPHIISIFTLILAPLIVFLARSGRIVAHSRIVLGFIVFAIVLGGLFSFVPGRLMGDLLSAIWK